MTYQSRVTDGGEFVIPAAMAQELGLRPGEPISLDRDGSSIVVTRYAEVIREGQRAFRAGLRYPFTVDEFLADRRADAASD